MRKDFQSPIEIIRSATSLPALMLGLPGKIGSVEIGAHADMIVMERDPLKDIAYLTESEKFSAILLGGDFIKTSLG